MIPPFCSRDSAIWGISKSAVFPRHYAICETPLKTIRYCRYRKYRSTRVPLRYASLAAYVTLRSIPAGTVGIASIEDKALVVRIATPKKNEWHLTF